jgi:mono/diheme cytochrome c family protein
VVVDLAPSYTAGLKIVEEVGCYGCHPIADFEDLPRPAPDLTRAAHKLDPAWTIQWIENPKLLRPDTRMPKFWPEMDAPDAYPYLVDVEAKREQRRQEAIAITAFLLAKSRASDKYTYALEPLPAGLAGDAERGGELVGSLGCAACHDLPDAAMTPERKNRASHFDYGPSLGDLGAKTSKEWIYSWIRDPKRYAPGARMPNLRLTEQEALDIATYLGGLRGDVAITATAEPATLAEPDLIAKGQVLVKKYGCYGCHLVEGFETTPGIGADLSAFGVKLRERLDFGDYITDHNAQTWNSWTVGKLRHPRVYSYISQNPVETFMPEFELSDDEIRKVMVFLKSQRKDAELESKVLTHRLTEAEAARERGRKLVRTYNCSGCHDLDGHDGEMASLGPLSGSNAIFGPPPLTAEGLKTQPAWLFEFLKRPFRMRPLPKVRMPTFGFSDEQAITLVTMFSALDGAPFPFTFYGDVRPADGHEYAIGKALFDASGCQKCHVVGELGDGAVPPEVKAPNLLMGEARLRPHWLDLWLADPGALQKNTAMPAFWLAANQMEMFLRSSPEFRAAIQGVPAEVVQEVAASPQRQIQAVRNFLFRMKSGAP